MRRFWILLVKELRELITPQTIAPIFLIIVVFLGLGKVISQQTKNQKQDQPVLVVDSDNTPASAGVIKLLGQDHLNITVQKQASDTLDVSKITNEKAVVVIPPGFGKDLAEGKQATLSTYTIQSGFSIAKLADTGLVSTAIAQLNAAIQTQRLAILSPHTSSAAVIAPVHNDEHMVASGKVAAISPSKVSAYIASQIALVPVVLFIVIIFAGQMVASAMANEKENKTLETLLSLPISRTSIVGAKMVAAGLVAGVTAAAYVYGINSIQSAFTGVQSVDAATKAAVNQLGLHLSFGSYALLGLVLFLGILAALAIALILGSFADNIKSLQSLLMPLILLLLIPYLATLTTNVQTLPLSIKAVLYAIPFTYTFQAMPNLYAHNYGIVLVGAAYELVFFAVFMVIAGKLFASDRLLTMRPGWVIRKK